MKRSAADGDLERDVRHLMLHLNDAPALRTNMLARGLVFPGDEQQFLSSLQAFVRSVLPPGSRMARIVQACDIEGEPHKVVAARLGVSMRQFYRDRLHAIELVQQTISVRRYVRVEHDGRDVLADELEALHDAVAYGRTGEALQRADRLLDEGVPPDLAAGLLALRARAHAEAGRPEPARAELQRARAQAHGEPHAVAEIGFAHGCALAAAGHFDRAIDAVRGAVAASAAPPGAPERVRRVRARYLAELGGLLQAGGCDPRGAVEALGGALELLRTCAIVPQGQVLHVCTELAASRLAIAEMVDHAAAEALEAQRSATWHGLAPARCAADVVVALATLTAGDPVAALARLPPAETLASGAGGAWLGRQLLFVSRVQNAAGDAAAALRTVDAARAVIPAEHALGRVADVRYAEALNAAGRPEHALRTADAALRRCGHARSHLLGALHLALADAHLRLGSAAAAVQHCRAGIELLRDGALVYDLACALRFAASLTGDPRYVREERGLLAG